MDDKQAREMAQGLRTPIALPNKTRVSSHHLRDDLQPSETLFPVSLLLFFDLHEHYACRQNTYTHKMNTSKNLFKN